MHARNRSRRPGLLLACLCATPALLAAPAFAQETRILPLPVMSPELPVKQIILHPSGKRSEGGAAGTCPPIVSTHTDASFTGGQYIAQGGFGETEIAAVSFVLPASAFPVRVDMAEMIFATSGATVQTTTHWSVLFWSGTPNTGTLEYVASSDGDILPHLVMPPGTNGTNIQFMIDANDPEQIYLQDNGSHTISFGFRIDHHNAQTQSPCLVAPPSNSNAFPTTDVGGLQHASQNWLYQLNCGSFGCGAGWTTFASLPSICRPSGDWVMRLTWTAMGTCPTIPTGACCNDGSCDILTQQDCQGTGGTYRGDGTACTATLCDNGAPVACCFPATGGCLNLPATQCASAGGVPGAAGSTCANTNCNPQGACCLPDGSCAGPMSPTACAQLGGTYKGDNSTCATVTCPPPLGAACFSNGFCLQLTQADAATAGATWKGPGTSCGDANGNGTADSCERAGDINGDGKVNGADIGLLLGDWGTSAARSDLNHDGVVNGGDIGILLGNWAP
ncbi:MAG: hypothetical protein U0625_07730 [Phycisphaerales bacterium]